MKIGIVGLPNVGKSTVFNALTAGYAPSSNYPFCTIEPNKGVVSVPDGRLDKLTSLVKAKEKKSVMIEFIDIAGLIKGASKGEGLGNRFLSHIREVDVVLHVVRCFIDTQISYPYPEIDPIRDMETVNLELLLADLEIVEERLKKYKETNGKREVLEEVKGLLGEGKFISSMDKEKIILIGEEGLLTSKPMVYAANIKEDDNDSLILAEKVRKKVEEEGFRVIVLAGKLEEEISHLSESEEEREKYQKELGVGEALKKLINICYNVINVITFYTIVHEKVTAWPIKEGTIAKEAAGEVHSDMKEGFIKVEIIPFDELVEFNSYQEAKERGKVRIEGKDYQVKDGDILCFRFH